MKRSFQCLVFIGVLFLFGCVQVGIGTKGSVLTEDRNDCLKKCGDNYTCGLSCTNSCDKYGCNEEKGKPGMRIGN